MDGGAWEAAVHGVAKSRTWLSDFTFTFHFHALETEMATHSSVLAWRIPGMREPGGLPSMLDMTEVTYQQQQKFSSIQLLSHVQLFATPQTAACQASLSITNPRVYSNSHPLSPWCHPAISSSVVPFSSCPQSFSASGSSQMSQFFASGGQGSICTRK